MAKDSELRMEFYINLIRTYCDKGDSTFGVFSGSKFMVASLVNTSSAFLTHSITSDYPRSRIIH